MAEVKWIKLTTDMFDNRKIKHLRKLPAGNDIVLIWVMLLTMAGRCNSGGMIYLTENIPYTPKMLADELGFEENVVIMALKALEELSMITMDSAYLTIPGWEEYQSVDGLERIREQTRKRVQKHREKQKQLECNVTETDGNAIEREEDKEKDTDKEKENTKESSPSNAIEDFNAEWGWEYTIKAYPKKTSLASAKVAWLDKLLEVIEPNRKAVAKLVYEATVAYIADYTEKNPNDTNYRYIPKYGEWLKEDCDYWIRVVEQRERGESS